MHVSGVTLDLNWFLQLILTVFFIVFRLLHLLKNTASKYLEVANFEASDGGGTTGRVGRGGGDCNSMSGGDSTSNVVCVVCGSKKCSRCKVVQYWIGFFKGSYVHN